MALDSIEQKILDKYGGGLDPVEQRILDKVRLPQDTGGGEGGVPDSTIAPDAAPIQPGVPVLPEGEPDGRFSGEADSESPVIFGEEDKTSTIGRIMKGLHTSVLALGGAQMQTDMARSGNQPDPEVMLHIAEEQQKFNQYTLEQMDYLDKPKRVIFNTAFALQQAGQKALAPPLTPLQKLQGGMVAPRFNGVRDAMAKGWSGEEAISPLVVVQSGFIGPDLAEKLQAWEKRHWQLRYQRIAADFASDIVADAAVDFLLGKAILTPIKSITKAGVVRFGTEAMKDRILKTAASKLDEGFESVAKGVVNDMADLKGPARRSLDDMLRENLDNLPDDLQAGGGNFTPPETVFQVTDADVLAQQSKLLVDRVRVGKLKGQIDKIDDQIARLDMQAPGIAGPQAQYDKFVLDSRRQLMTDQLVQATKKTDDSRTILAHLEEGRHAIDFKATSRELRQTYVDVTLKSMDGDENFDSVKEFIKTVSGNTTDDIAELTDEEFDALFDFIETRIKDPKNWNYASTDIPGMEGNIKRIGRSLFLNQTASPTWQVFRRLGGERIYQFVDDAFFQRYAHVENSLSRWADELVNLGIHGKKRSDKGMESLRKVFLLADDRATSIDDGVATFNVTSGPTAKESWITPVSPAEIRAGKFINKQARVLADMAVAQGRLSATGDDAPKVIKHYITHLFDQNIVGAKKAKEVLLENIDALKATLDDLSPADTLMTEREIAELQGLLDGEDVNIRKLAEHYEKNAKTDVNIPEFLARTNYREGLLEDADSSFRAMITHETDALYMQPAYKKAMVMAKETGNDNLEQVTRKWINDIRGVPTKAETALEPRVKDFSLLLEHGTSWIPWQRAQWKAEDKAVRQFSKVFRSKTYAAAMGFNPGPVATNMTQGLLNISAIGWKPTVKGMESLTTEGGKSALRHARILVGRNPMHSMSLREMSRLQRAGGWAFRQVDQWMNVAPAFNGSLYKQITRDPVKMSLLRNYGEVEGRGFWNSLGKALDAGEFAGDVDIANRVAKITQYSYLRHDAPAFLRTPLGGLFGQFMSWPANYWQSFIPEMAKWMATGDSPFGKLGLIERATLLRHIVLAEALVQSGGQAGIDLKKHRPVAFSTPGGLPAIVPQGAVPQTTPMLRIATGIVGLATAGGNKRKEEAAILEIKKGFMVGPAGIPFFPAALRRAGKTIGEGDARHLFWRVSEDDGSGEFGQEFDDPSLDQ